MYTLKGIMRLIYIIVGIILMIPFMFRYPEISLALLGLFMFAQGIGDK